MDRNGPTGGHESRIIGAERAVIGALMIEPSAIEKVGELTPADFLDPKLSVTYRAILAAHADSGLMDPIAVERHLDPRDGVGRGLLLDLVEEAVHAAAIDIHADEIRKAAQARRVVLQAQRLAKLAQEPGADLGELVAAHEESLRTMMRSEGCAGTWVSPADVVSQWRLEGPLRHEPTGIPTLDEITGGGLTPGTCMFLVGAPDAGKTLLETVIADEYQSRGLTVGLLAVDEDARRITTRLLQSTLR